jgi:hypothetical protein
VRGESRAQYNPQRHVSVDVGELLRAAGAPAGSRVPAGQLGRLRCMVLEKYGRAVAGALQREFGWGPEWVALLRLQLGASGSECAREPREGGSEETRIEDEARLEEEEEEEEAEAEGGAASSARGREEKGADKMGVYECRPWEDIGAGLRWLPGAQGQTAFRRVEGVEGWDRCREECDADLRCQALSYSLHKVCQTPSTNKPGQASPLREIFWQCRIGGGDAGSTMLVLGGHAAC